MSQRIQPSLGVLQRNSPFGAYGVTPMARTQTDAPASSIPGIARSAGPGLASEALHAKPWSPDSPLFWFGALAAFTFGLAGVSFAGRVGPARAAASLGNT